MTKVRRQRRSFRRDRIEVWRIILWSGLTNLVLLSVFFVAQHINLGLLGGPKGPAEKSHFIVNPANAATTADLLGPKGDFSAGTITVGKTEPDAEAPDDAATEEESTADLALSAGASVEDSETLRAEPILRRSPQSGKLEIGSFKSLSVVGSPEDCLNFGNALLRDSGAANEKLDVVTAVHEITIARICAANGSVIITCRGGQISVSPRRSRPDDQCAKNT